MENADDAYFSPVISGASVPDRKGMCEDKLCEHLKLFLDVTRKLGLKFDNNDNYADWIECPKCNIKIHIHTGQDWVPFLVAGINVRGLDLEED